MYKTINTAVMEKILFDSMLFDDSNFAQIKMTDGTLNSCSAMHVEILQCNNE